MRKFHNLEEIKPKRKTLRNFSTPQEKMLWLYLKGKQIGCKFRRQQSIGRYIVDFYCSEKKLIVEIDGGHHRGEKNKEYDDKRDEYLERLGFRVLRFWNSEIDNNLDDVIERIRDYLK